MCSVRRALRRRCAHVQQFQPNVCYDFDAANRGRGPFCCFSFVCLLKKNVCVFVSDLHATGAGGMEEHQGLSQCHFLLALPGASRGCGQPNNHPRQVACRHFASTGCAMLKGTSPTGGPARQVNPPKHIGGMVDGRLYGMCSTGCWNRQHFWRL